MKKLLLLSLFGVALIATSCKEKANENAALTDAASEAATATGNSATSTANSGAQSISTENTSGKYPVMTFDKTEHDFGTIAQGTNVEHMFTFTNTGDAPLIISDAKGSCGCTVPTFTREPIQPGQKGELLVHFNGTGSNQRTISVNITTNTQRVTERVTIKAFVQPKEAN
ncbi:MAG TPA: DUF1573 domain-containing protein [Flavobacteriaceae bacterium]|nr:DUF1573 domain-containing protein [Flavobacteriaceae bacterium]